MAKIKVPIVINGLDFVRNTIVNFTNNFVFEDATSDEFKAGFHAFAEAVINSLDEIIEAEASDEQSTILETTNRPKETESSLL